MKTKKIMYGLLLLGFAGAMIMSCEDQSAQLSEEDPMLSVAELSSQLSSGTEISFTSASAGSSASRTAGNTGGRPRGGTRGQTRDANLSVVSMAERIGNGHNMRMLGRLGADVKYYDANGTEVTIDFSEYEADRGALHEAFSTIAKIEIDFSNSSSARGITLAGKVTINREVTETSTNETVLFENFSVNGSVAEGSKSIQRTFNKETGEMHLTSEVIDGKITLADGQVLDWISSKKRDGFFTFDTEGALASGYSFMESSTSLTKDDGTVWYSYKTPSPIKVDMACSERRPKPVSGQVETIYDDNTIVVDFGDGSCDNQSVSVTLNGVTKSRPVRG